MGRVQALTLAAVTTAVMALGAGTAGATIFERGSWTDEPYSFSHTECGFKVNVAGTSSGHYRIREGKGRTATAFFEMDNYAFSETQTNPANGKWLTITANASFREVKATRVEGTAFHFWAVESGQFRMYDSSGNLVARDRGSVRFHILFDTGGDDVPGGTLIEEFDPVVHGPHPGFDDFCGLIAPLIGP